MENFLKTFQITILLFSKILHRLGKLITFLEKDQEKFENIMRNLEESFKETKINFFEEIPK